MAAEITDRDAYISENPNYISCDSGYVTDESTTEEDSNIDATAHAHPVGSATATRGNEQMSGIISRRRMLEGGRILSRIPASIRRTQAHSNTTSLNELYDRSISDIRRALNLPTLSPSQQIAFNSILNALFALRDAAHSPLPLQENAPRNNSRPVYGPQPRPLSTAAIRQNARAWTRRLHTATLGQNGYQFPLVPVYTAPPIRYSHPYDDLLGSRSLDDGTAGAHAERNGHAATYAIRFSEVCHNGHSFGKCHLHITTEDRNLVEARQARALAGLSTQDMDGEIAYRVLRDIDAWGTCRSSLNVRYTLIWYAETQVGSAHMYAKLSGLETQIVCCSDAEVSE
jgi:hypothetical protein